VVKTLPVLGKYLNVWNLSMIRIKYLRNILDYNPETGVLTWKKDTAHLLRGQTDRKGQQAGKCGQLSILGQSYATNIIAWMIHYGERPISTLRPIDDNRKNVRIKNMTDTGSSTNRVCTECGAVGGKETFYHHKTLKAGLTAKCRGCIGEVVPKGRRGSYKPKKKAYETAPVFMPPIVVRSLGG